MKKLEKVSGFINEAYLADSTIIDAGTFNIERTSFASVCVILLLVCKHSKFQIESKSAEFQNLQNCKQFPNRIIQILESVSLQKYNICLSSFHFQRFFLFWIIFLS